MLNNIKPIIITSFLSVMIFVTEGIAEQFYMEASNGAVINLENKTLVINDDVEFTLDLYNLTADQVKISYVSLENMKENLQKHSPENFKRIEALGNVRLSYINNLLTGDELIYDVDKNIVILRSKISPTIYTGEKLELISQERIEYQTEEMLLVARGNPVVNLFSNDGDEKKHEIRAELFVAKLTEDFSDLEYVQALDGVTVKTTDGSLLKGDYATFSAKDNQVVLEDNVSISKDNSILNGCRLVLDLETGESILLPCANQKNFFTTITR